MSEDPGGSRPMRDPYGRTDGPPFLPKVWSTPPPLLRPRPRPPASPAGSRGGSAPVPPTGPPTTGAGLVPFRLGPVLRRSLSFLRRRWPFVLTSTVLLHAPVALWGLRAREGRVLEVWFTLPVSFLNPLLLVLALVLQATVVHAVYRDLAGRPSGALAPLAGLPRLPVVLVVALLVGLSLLGPLFAGSVLGVGLATARPVAFAVVATVLVLLGMVASMLAIVCSYSVAVQAAIVEGGGPVQAMIRSARLTRGHRWPLLALLLVTYGGQFGTFLLLSWVHRPWWRSGVAFLLALHALQAVVSAFHAVFAAVAYHDLRRDKEGFGVEDLLRVFE